MTSKLFITAGALALACVSGAPAFAVDEYNVSTGTTTKGVPLGVHGVDTVALATFNAVAEGHAAHVVVDEGGAYYLASDISARTCVGKLPTPSPVPPGILCILSGRCCALPASILCK